MMAGRPQKNCYRKARHGAFRYYPAGLDGLAVFKKMRSQTETFNTPVILLTMLAKKTPYMSAQARRSRLSGQIRGYPAQVIEKWKVS